MVATIIWVCRAIAADQRPRGDRPLRYFGFCQSDSFGRTGERPIHGELEREIADLLRKLL